MDEFTKKTIYYLNNPKYQKELEKYTHKYYYKSKVCGDILKIKIQTKNNIIEDIGYTLSGCALNVAGIEIISNYLIKKNINEIKNLNLDLIENELEIPKEKSHCIDLIFETLNHEDR